MDRNIGDRSFVGQDKLIHLIDTWKSRNAFPHFILASGPIGSGRKSLCYLLSKSLDSSMSIINDLSVESIRGLVNIAYEIDSKILYVIPDADSMSVAAKNTLLKLTEEPPENAYIVMTLQSLDNTLPTLKSRSQHLVIEPYSYKELYSICEDELIASIANTPGMIRLLQDMGKDAVEHFVDTCSKLVNHIDKVSIANALKSADIIKFKDSDKGIDVQLMIAGIEYVLESCINNHSQIPRMSCWYRCLLKYKPMINRIGVNKKAIYDQLIFDIRRVIREAGA